MGCENICANKEVIAPQLDLTGPNQFITGKEWTPSGSNYQIPYHKPATAEAGISWNL